MRKRQGEEMQNRSWPLLDVFFSALNRNTIFSYELVSNRHDKMLKRFNISYARALLEIQNERCSPELHTISKNHSRGFPTIHEGKKEKSKKLGGKKHLVWHFFPMSVAFFYSAVIKSSLELLLQNVEYNLSNIYYIFTAKQWIFDPRKLHETKTNCSGWFSFRKHVLNLSQNTCQRSFLVFLSKRDKRKNIYFSFRWTKASAW